MLVTVLMSVYNSDKYLEKSINSILTQTYKDFEFIIVDDGSTDNSLSIIEKYQNADSRIILIKNESNMGLPAALNKGIKAAKGMYIARQDADDLSSPQRLEIQLKFALENPEVDMIGTNCYVIDISGDIVYYDSSYSKTNNFREKLLNQEGIFPHGSALLKRSRLLEVGLYDPRFYYTQDGEYWLRLITSGAKVQIINQPLYFYRTGPVAFTKRAKAKRMFNKVLNLIYNENKNLEQASHELEKTRSYLITGPLESRPFYVADYWKSLGNAAYLNGSTKSVTYRYIIKALMQRNSISNYFKYFFLTLVYVFPPELVKRIAKKS